MIRALRNLGRIWTILRTLARHDAAAPPAIAVPFGPRVAMRLIGFPRRRAMRRLRPGQRLAKALDQLGRMDIQRPGFNAKLTRQHLDPGHSPI